MSKISADVAVDNDKAILDLISNNPGLEEAIRKVAICKALHQNSFKILSSLIEVYDTNDIENMKTPFKNVFRYCTNWSDVRALIGFGMQHQGALKWLRDPCGRNALHVALKHGDVNLCQDIVDKGPELLGLLSSCGQTPLHVAILARRHECVDMFLSSGADPNATSREGMAPITLAVITTNFEAFNSLIKAGADINRKDKCGMSPLHHAVANGHFEYVQTLIACGALEAKETMNSLKISVLHLAITKGHVSIMNLLLQNGCSPASFDRAQGWGAIHCASADCPDPECMSCLLNHPETDVNLRTRDGRTPLMLAVSYGQCGMVNRLVKHPGCKLNMLDTKSGMTALHRAADAGCYQCTKVLLQNGSFPDVPDLDGATPLLLAVNSRHTHLIGELLLWGPGRWPWRPLQKKDQLVVEIAVKRGYWDIIQAVILSGWNTGAIHRECEEKRAAAQTVTKGVKEALFLPHALKNLCRLKIRVCYGATVSEYAQKLGLPSTIKDYLAFKDLNNHLFWCS